MKRATAAGLILALCAAQASALPVKTLDECIAIAVDQHPSLKAASASVEAAHQRVYQAASGYLPQLNAHYDANRRRTSLSAQTGTTAPGVTTRVSTAMTSNFYDSSVSFSQILFDFGRRLD